MGRWKFALHLPKEMPRIHVAPAGSLSNGRLAIPRHDDRKIRSEIDLT